MSGSTLPTGAWPVMLTPFNENRSIDWVAVDDYTDWLIELGSAGLFAVALSSEMYDLSHDERLELSARVVERAAGRVPVVASSAVSGSAGEQAEEARRGRADRRLGGRAHLVAGRPQRRARVRVARQRRCDS